MERAAGMKRKDKNEVPDQLSEAEESAIWAEVVERGATYASGPMGDHAVDVAGVLIQLGEYSDDAAEAATSIVAALKEWELLYSRGRTIALLQALDWSAVFSLPPPTWAANGLSDAMQRWMAAEVKSFDEALGLERPKNWNQSAARFEAEGWPAVSDAVVELRAAGYKFDDALWEQVETTTGVGASTARRWWYRNQRPR